MHKKFDHPAIWRGTELANDPQFKLQMTREQLAELSAFANSENELSHEKLDHDLPTLAPLLAEVQDGLENGPGVVILKGLQTSDFDELQLRKIFAATMSHVGTAVSQSAEGDRILSVRNEGFGKDDSRTRGPNTKNRLSFHTDRCDVIAFLCIKQAKSGGDNFVVNSMALHNEIVERRPELLDILKEPFYYKRHNVDTGNALAYIKQPIFSVFEGHFAANILRVLIERAYQTPEIGPMSDLQREALDYVEELCEDSALHFQFRQEPGDIVLMNNFITFHRRDAFEDFDELENRRHLLRIWLSVPNSRPLDPLFAGNYGATEAGAIRGGMKAR